MGVMVYGCTLGANITTNATPATTNDFFFIKPGAAGRAVTLVKVDLIGKGAALTSISGIAIRVEKWFTTASSGGTGITPSPKDPGMQASKATAGASATTVTSGTGGPTLMGSFGCGAAGPGGWVARNQDDGYLLEAGANQSLDLFNVSGTASLNFEAAADIQE